ncbi:MAG TPA: hypothetical protein VFF30_13080 [Nitrososphaerales archaeon]|nr:hypothetical protein [Nitrososphaerales archaeon]
MVIGVSLPSADAQQHSNACTAISGATSSSPELKSVGVGSESFFSCELERGSQRTVKIPLTLNYTSAASQWLITSVNVISETHDPTLTVTPSYSNLLEEVSLERNASHLAGIIVLNLAASPQAPTKNYSESVIVSLRAGLLSGFEPFSGSQFVQALIHVIVGVVEPYPLPSVSKFEVFAGISFLITSVLAWLLVRTYLGKVAGSLVENSLSF